MGGLGGFLHGQAASLDVYVQIYTAVNMFIFRQHSFTSKKLAIFKLNGIIWNI